MAIAAELIKKLQIKPGQKLRLINAPADIAEALADEVTIVKSGRCDGVIAFAQNPAEADRFSAEALKALPPDGLLWLAYRKGAAAKASGLSRDTGWGTIKAAGWDTVRSISFDEEWTGLRFRPAELIKR